ncbi:hypothetical protein AGLY_003465 [Aphis glycines]|uniref:Uncharacterized protein n=1 Tax=Aphis glycines TaxID=307491 RepID=A0A6G0TZP9_APHGL|nr:hypothetical protein AGLY_003465 [Aphis glycines]
MLYPHVLSPSYTHTTYQIFVHQFQKYAVSFDIRVLLITGFKCIADFPNFRPSEKQTLVTFLFSLQKHDNKFEKKNIKIATTKKNIISIDNRQAKGVSSLHIVFTLTDTNSLHHEDYYINYNYPIRTEEPSNSLCNNTSVSELRLTNISLNVSPTKPALFDYIKQLPIKTKISSKHKNVYQKKLNKFVLGPDHFALIKQNQLYGYNLFNEEKYYVPLLKLHNVNSYYHDYLISAMEYGLLNTNIVLLKCSIYFIHLATNFQYTGGEKQENIRIVYHILRVASSISKKKKLNYANLNIKRGGLAIAKTM